MRNGRGFRPKRTAQPGTAREVCVIFLRQMGGPDGGPGGQARIRRCGKFTTAPGTSPGFRRKYVSGRFLSVTSRTNLMPESAPAEITLPMIRESLYSAVLCDALDALGFTNPFHFSRVFRRHRGVPPSASKTV